MSDSENTPVNDNTEQQAPQPNFDPALLACRVVDVHAALQHSFTKFVESGENSLESLAKVIQDTLGEIPAFLMSDVQPKP